MNSIQLFYKNGVPTDIIYNGNHCQFRKSELTKTQKNKYLYTAELDELLFIHDHSHIIAVFEGDQRQHTIYHCNEKKDNNKLHGPGTAILYR